MVLKGGVLVAAYGTRRPTRDIDFAASDVAGNRASLHAIIDEILGVELNDGLRFDQTATTSEPIREEDVYTGARFKIFGTLSTTQVRFHVDFNIGDPLGPEAHPVQVRSPTSSKFTVGGPNSADAFQRAAAPVYLRRNQTDVLDELPEKIETADWLPLDGAAADTYRRAVASGNFMAMRRAAFLTDNPAESPKLTRLREIVEEATDNDRKVIVYSYFRDVLHRVHEALGPLAMGPLTGSVSGPRRQELVDEFSTRREPAVLVSQIEAGGIGLNIQAASVVIIAEPQWKPSTEEQAIARSHRMGQIRPVEVHRLLTENSVDEYMLAILARKSALFASYIRPSAMKDATSAAVDSSGGFTSQSTQEEQIIESERCRLGLVA